MALHGKHDSAIDSSYICLVAPLTKEPRCAATVAVAGNCAENETAHNRHLCRKTAVLNCHRCLISTGVEKMNKIEI